MRAALLAIAAAAVAIALLFARPQPTPGPPMRDFEAYYAAGQTWSGGGDPYGTGIWQRERVLDGVDRARYAPLPFVGPPATLPLWSAFARLPFSAANVVWRGVLLAAVLALVAAAVRTIFGAFSPFALLCIAVFALGFGPLTSGLALGQIALPAFACAVLAALFRPAGIFAWAQPNVAAVLIAQAVHRAGAAAFAAGAAIFTAACIAVAGANGALNYLHVLAAHSRSERFSAIQVTPAAIAYGFGVPEPAALAIGIAIAIGAAAAWLLFVRPIEDDTARLCATCALLPLAMPFFHEHDLVLLFLPAAYFSVRCEQRLWPLAAAGALLCATDWLGLAQRPSGTLQTLLLVGGAGLALVALRRDAAPRMLAIPAGILALIAAAAIPAHLHPAPIWPDAMRALPQGGANIAAVWHQEQAATGLFARDGIWAALRAGSLLGCALVSYAAALSSRLTARSRSPLPAPAAAR
jgi:alpha-1,2-mannosyltransferase